MRFDIATSNAKNVSGPIGNESVLSAQASHDPIGQGLLREETHMHMCSGKNFSMGITDKASSRPDSVIVMPRLGLLAAQAARSVGFAC